MTCQGSRTPPAGWQHTGSWRLHLRDGRPVNEAKIYDKVGKDFNNHNTVNHSAGEYVNPIQPWMHTNTVESSFAILKRGLYGTFHSVSEAHLQRYANEFDFRWNTRQKLGFSDATEPLLLSRASLASAPGSFMGLALRLTSSAKSTVAHNWRYAAGWYEINPRHRSPAPVPVSPFARPEMGTYGDPCACRRRSRIWSGRPEAVRCQDRKHTKPTRPGLSDSGGA